MQPIPYDSILDLRTYERKRSALQRAACEAAGRRTVQLGDSLTVVFRSRPEERFNLHEYLRSRRIRDEEEIRDTLAEYNTLLPADGVLAARVVVSAAERSEITRNLWQFAGLPGTGSICFRRESGRTKSGTISTVDQETREPGVVYFLRFEFTGNEADDYFRRGDRLALRIHYQSYESEAVLSGEMQEILRADLNLDL